MVLTNKEDVPLVLAVWLAHSDYDFNPDERTISATSILKPIKQIVLERRGGEKKADVIDLLAAAYGSTLHSGIENAWLSNKLPETLSSLGIPEKQINRVRVNPEEPEEGAVNVFLEKRSEKEIQGWKISGKFDCVINGHLFDNKSTSVWTYIYGSRVEEYKSQCSIYKWLNPDLITDDTFSINYIFTDWSKQDAIKKKSEGYPSRRLIEAKYELYPKEFVEGYLIKKLDLVKKYLNAPEEDIPRCTNEDLWRGPAKYKYYSDSTKTAGKATRTFDNREEAYTFMGTKGKGIVIESLGEPRRCKYCNCYDICGQRREYYADEFSFNNP